MIVLAYLVALYVASRLHCAFGRRDGMLVSDALLVNWIACEAIARMNGLFPPVAGYIAIDAATGVWLASMVRTRFARWIASFYIATILFNAAYAFAWPSMTPFQHWTGLALLAWCQVVAVLMGAWRDGVQAVRGVLDRLLSDRSLAGARRGAGR